MRNLQIEALFGGALALVVIVIAAVALANTDFETSKARQPADDDPVPVKAETSLKNVTLSNKEDADLVCECFNKAFSLARNGKVLSAEYRTGFEQCRTRAGYEGGDAWTAGWNARKESRAFESSCRAYKRNVKKAKEEQKKAR